MAKHKIAERAKNDQKRRQRRKYPPGECFHNAWKWATQHDGQVSFLRVVHGILVCRNYVTPDTPSQIWHAWIEFGDAVIDPTKNDGAGYRRDDFYHKFGVLKQFVRRYTLAELNALVAEHGDTGPWHEAPPGTIEKP